MAATFKIDTARRVADGIAKSVLSVGMAPKGYYLLTTIGRRSGKPRSTPVVLVEEGNKRWLVAPFGAVGWVHNAKAAGKVTLTRNGKSETLAIREVTPQQAAPVLRKYVVNVAVTRPYFDVGTDSSEEAYMAEASKHPVFELSVIET